MDDKQHHHPILRTTHPLSAQELFGRRSTAESLERHLHEINNRITEREVIFLQSANGVFIAGIADADGDVFIGHKWGSPLYVSTLSSIVPWNDI